MMLTQALRMLLFLTLITGLAYPVLVTALAQGLCPRPTAEGLGRPFDQPHQFWGRPSACNYNPLGGAASQLGPSSAVLKEALQQRRQALGSKAPSQLLTSSGSGLDPHLAPEAVQFQLERVSSATGLSREQLQALIGRHTLGRQWGFMGQVRVDLVGLNRELAQQLGKGD